MGGNSNCYEYFIEKPKRYVMFIEKIQRFLVN